MDIMALLQISTDNQNMEDFEKTGWKLSNPKTIDIISETLHEKLLEESLIKYKDIWEKLARC